MRHTFIIAQQGDAEKMRVKKVLWLFVIIVVLASAAAQSTDITLLVASDTHFTSKSLPAKVKTVIQAMNSHLVGIPYPSEIGGTVDQPIAAIICGDLCDGGAGISATDTPKSGRRNYQDQWNGFDYYFPKNGVTGDNNRLRFPNYATAGNHDFYNNFGWALSGKSWYVANKLVQRYELDCNITNGNVYYSFDIDGVHFASLGRYADTYVLTWLSEDLAAVGTETPVVLFLHYAFNDGQSWYTDAERAKLAAVIRGYRVIAILHGHTHVSTHYVWQGYDCYDDGSAGKNGDFGVLRITDDTLTYCQYKAVGDTKGNWKSGSWKWAHKKTF